MQVCVNLKSNQPQCPLYLMVCSVASLLLMYPFMIMGPWMQSSPGSFGPFSSPVPTSTTFNLLLGRVGPEDPGFTLLLGVTHPPGLSSFIYQVWSLTHFLPDLAGLKCLATRSSLAGNCFAELNLSLWPDLSSPKRL